MRVLMPILALLCAAPAWATPTIEVAPRAEITGPTVRLGEIAQLRGFSKARTRELAAIEVGKSPNVGLGQYMPRAYLESRIRRAGVSESVRLPLRVELSRKTKTIDGEYIAGRVRAALAEGMPHDPRDLAEVRVPSIADIVVPAQADLDVRFAADEDFTGAVTADVVITDAGELVRRRRVNAHIDLLVDALGVSEEMRRGGRLTTAHLMVLRIAQSRLPKDAIIKPEFIDGAIVRRTIRPGEPIREAFLKVPPLVERGQRVRMVARRGDVSVTTIGEALASGPRGARIRVRNLASRKIVGGKVISSGVVEMEF